MKEVQELLEIADSLRVGLPNLKVSDDETVVDNYREALLAILAAADRSRGYLDQLRDAGGRRSAHGSQALRHAWSSAAIGLIPFDAELAGRCRLRTPHWSRARAWSDDQANLTRRALDDVSTTVRSLLATIDTDPTIAPPAASARPPRRESA